MAPLRVLQTLGGYALFALGAALLSWLVLPFVWLCGGSVFQRQRRCQSVAAAALRFFHAYLRRQRLIDLDPARVPLHCLSALAAGASRPCIVIANHPTLIDTTALLATVRHLCCVVPSGYYYNPALLPLLWCCGHLHARGRSIASGVGVLQLALQRLAAGHSLLIFPEGTRSPSQSLGPFKRGAFEIAQQANVELVPVVLRVSRPVLNHSTPWYALPPQAVAYGIEVLPSFAVGYQSTKAASAHASKLFALALGISAQVEQQ